ncbi:MAG: NusA-like transcription termination signal-binding factor [Nanoarchaeota archaeon]|nr:NusA-like transcription termination signal-binding factor [Nanoarchaeota archaeon]
MKLDMELIGYINLFEKITRCHVKDSFPYSDKLLFVVGPGQASKAVGKKGANIKKLSDMINKKLKVVEFSDDPATFLKSFISPIKAQKIEINCNIAEITVRGRQEKGLLIGRDKNNLNCLKEIVKKYFKIEDVKIL